MMRFGRAARVFVASAVALGGLAAAGGTASATHQTPGQPCMVVTEDTSLTGDVGPCEGHGIVVTANDVTLDLNGHTVTGAKREMEQAGVLLQGVRGVTVRNGTVTGFDAGVAIEGGSGNTVTRLTVQDNVNDMIESVDPRSIIVNRETGPTPEQRMQIGAVTCLYGDGITVVGSRHNAITRNTVSGNGPFGGITVVGDSDGNLVRGNDLFDNDLRNVGVTDAAGIPVYVDNTEGSPTRGRHVLAGSPGAVRPNSMCGAAEIGTPGMSRGREMQAIGIRLEGPGADGNQVDRNWVTKSGLAGISIHSFVLNPAAPNVPQERPNLHNTVRRNTVSRTGADTSTIDPFADGIAVLASGPVGTVTMPSNSNTIVGNTSFDNARHGISLGRLTSDTIVDRNFVVGNGGSGIWLAGPAASGNGDLRGAHDNRVTRNHGRDNAAFDGTDLNPNCDDNVWRANRFRTFNQLCVATARRGGGGDQGGGVSPEV